MTTKRDQASTIQTDEDVEAPRGTTDNFTEDQTVDALLSRWGTSQEAASEGGDEEGEAQERPEEPEGDLETGTEEAEEDREDEESDEDPEASEETEGEDEEEAEAAKVAEDDAEVVIRVGDEEQRVSVKDLKRLYGQEAALTRRAQELSERRKEVESVQQKYSATLGQLLQRAEEKVKQYQEIDWARAATQLKPDELRQLQEDAKAAQAEYNLVDTQAQDFLREQQETQQRELRDRAKRAVEELKDPASPHHIENWGEEVYNTIRDFAVKSGIPAETINSEVDPAVIKLVWMASQYNRIKSQASQKKPVKTKASPRRSMQPQGRREQRDTEARSRAMSKLKQTGTLDDAVDAIMAWERDRE